MTGHYWSESKGAWIPFAEMNHGHLMNAWRKLARSFYDEPDEGKQSAIAAKVDELRHEIERRGYVLVDGKWEIPQPPAT